MTPRSTTARTLSTASADGGCALPIDRLAQDVKRRWHGGEQPDVAAVLSENPQLHRYRSVVLDLAYEEYCLRCRAGETVDVDEFSRRFPSMQRSLCLLIEVNRLLDQESGIPQGPDTSAWPEPGSRFLGFELIEEIGRGAFGRVYLASEPALGDRPVAVKVALHGGQEAEVLGRLHHPNIVPVYSIQHDHRTGLTVFCMPYLGRVTLADILDHASIGTAPPTGAQTILKVLDRINEDVERPASAPDRILRRGSYVDAVILLTGQLADALAHAHQRGVCHRDLKPSNVLVAPDGRPLLLDFNLSSDEQAPSGRVGGTLPYMAPEQLQAFAGQNTAVPGRCDPRCDLFSLGVILYELLAGHHPFRIPWGDSLAATAGALVQQQFAGPRPLQEANPHVDPKLARLVERCLAPNPDQRPQTAGELASLLRRELTFWRRGGRWVRSHRLFVYGIGAVLAAAALAVAIAWASAPPYSVRQYQRGLAESRRGAYQEAIECFSNVLRTDPGSRDALIARGKASHRLGDFRMAYTDYSAAYRLAPSSELNVLRGYCLSRLSQNTEARVHYEAAAKAGEASPALFNNLGDVCRRLNRLPEAETYLRRALELDEGLQAVHHNLMLVIIHRAMQGQPIPVEAFEHARRALDGGPLSADLYRDVAILYALAAQRDRAFIRPAIIYTAKAVEHGIAPNTFASSPAFAAVEKDDDFKQALAKPVHEKLPPVDHLVDPLPRAAESW